MGGLSGHMLHPYEDFDLRISDIKDLILKTFTGQLNLIEKVDGYNIQILIAKKGKSLDIRYLRSKKDLKEGGISYSQLPERFGHNLKFLRMIRSSHLHIRKWVNQHFQYLEQNGYINNPEMPIAVELLYCNSRNRYITNTIPYMYEGSPVKVIFHGFEEYEKRDFLKIDSISDNEVNIEQAMEVINDFLFTSKQIDNNITLRTYYQQRYFEFINSIDFGYGLNKDTLSGLISDGFDYLFEKNGGKDGKITTFAQLSKKHILPDNPNFNLRFLGLVDGKSEESKTFLKKLKKYVFMDIKTFFINIGDWVINQVQEDKYGYNKHKLVNGLLVGNKDLLEQFEDNYRDNTSFTALKFDYPEYFDFDIKFRILEGVVFKYDGTGGTYKYTGFFPILNRVNQAWLKN